ncbi:isochorismatase family protein [Subtercola endophyticus]|uniref:isochorismatase family protein n=1 Tax=Subtercola endophyticus TaxID=2895559 RepID=UPI001E2D7645|nr:isochorismatase family protein [Subtercola endophyticus]UFS58460.1 isochorismatase family protein [Subtercola endophyticus]
MPITALDERTALIVIDLQAGIVKMPVIHPIDEVIARSAALATEFRRRGLPVVLVSVDGRPGGRTDVNGGSAGTPSAFPADWLPLVDELDPQPTDIRVTKQTGSAFVNTGLDEKLKQLGVTQVVVTGVSTSNGVESTALYAFNHGYHVTIPTDAVTDGSAESHSYSVGTRFPRIAETGTTDEVLALLASARS